MSQDDKRRLEVVLKFSRAGRHRIPAERGIKMRKFYVWGTGLANSQVVREGVNSADALLAALSEGAQFDWAVEVEMTEEEVDAITRFDSAVHGWKTGY